MRATQLPIITTPDTVFVLFTDDMGVVRLGRTLPTNIASGEAALALTTANTAITNAAAAQSTANTAITNAAAAQATATAATSTHSTLTYTATTDIDFTLANYRSLALGGNIIFTTSNRAAPRTVSIKILCDGSPRNFTFPVGWIFVGSAAPASIAASKTAILTVTCFGTLDANIVAAYAVEP